MTLQAEEINTEAVCDSVNTAALKCHSNVCMSLSIGKSVQNGSISSVYASLSIMWKCGAHLKFSVFYLVLASSLAHSTITMTEKQVINHNELLSHGSLF